MRTFTLIITIILLFGSLECYAQCETFTFTRQGQIDSFAINYPMCIDIEELRLEGRAIQNLNGLNQIKSIAGNFSYGSITIFNTSLTNFSGLQLESYTGEIILSNNVLLEEFSIDFPIDSAFACEASGNEALKFIEMQCTDSTDVALYISNNELLESISPRGAFSMDLDISYCPSFQNFHGFSDIEMIYDFNLISNSHMENFEGFENVRSIEYLFIETSPDLEQTFQTMEGLEALEYINSLSVLGVHSLKGLETLRTAGSISLGSDFSSDTAYNLLTDLNGLQNLTTIERDLNINSHNRLRHLHHLSPNLIIGENLNVENNPKLNDCSSPVICRHINQNKPHLINNNGPLCSDPSDILTECEGFKVIPVRHFYDINKNKLFDANEPIIRNINMTIDSDNLFLIDQSENQFKYARLDPGDHVIGFEENPLWELTTDSSTYFINGEATYYDTIFNFGFSPLSFQTDISNSNVLINPRCITKAPFDVQLVNNGTSIAEGYQWIQVSTNIDTICFPKNIPDTIISTHHFGYKFSNLYPGTSIKESLIIGIPGPPDFMIGDSFYVKSYATFEDQNGIATSDTNFLNEEIRCSYDPNDKLVNPRRANDNYTLIDETLNYTIRFQNTGNAEAYDVVIRDTLDLHLDVSTFKLIGSSHQEILQTFIKDDQYITFEFKNIFLPDSTTDFEGSNGYVSYTIDHKEGIDENTKIENTAHIYFDFNPPIVTNTTENIMVSMFPTATNDLYPGLDINIYPNPTDGLLYLEGEDLEWNAMVEIVDLNGKVVLENQLGSSQQVNLAGLNQGVYFVHIIQRRGRFSGKVIVE